MSQKFDHALKSHFAGREDVPPELKPALRAKLHSLQQRQDKPHFVWLLAPCMIFAVIAILFAVEMFFGMGAVLVLGLGYYIVATFGTGAVVLFMLVTKKARVKPAIS